MSDTLKEEVWDYAPAIDTGISQAELNILGFIADASQTKGRFVHGRFVPARHCFPSPASLSRVLRMKEATITKALQRLAARGLECRVAIGKNKNGDPLFAVPGQPRELFLPDLKAWAKAHGQEPQGLGKGGTNSTLSGSMGGTDSTHRVEQVPVMGGTGSNQNPNEPEVKPPPTPAPVRTVPATSPMGGTGRKLSAEKNRVEAIRELVTDWGIDEHLAGQMVTLAEHDPETKYSYRSRLKMPLYQNQLREIIKNRERSERLNERAQLPPCAEHDTGHPAESCADCRTEIRSFPPARLPAYMGRIQPRCSDTSCGAPVDGDAGHTECLTHERKAS